MKLKRKLYAAKDYQLNVKVGNKYNIVNAADDAFRIQTRAGRDSIANEVSKLRNSGASNEDIRKIVADRKSSLQKTAVNDFNKRAKKSGYNTLGNQNSSGIYEQVERRKSSKILDSIFKRDPKFSADLNTGPKFSANLDNMGGGGRGSFDKFKPTATDVFGSSVMGEKTKKINKLSRNKELFQKQLDKGKVQLTDPNTGRVLSKNELGKKYIREERKFKNNRNRWGDSLEVKSREGLSVQARKNQLSGKYRNMLDERLKTLKSSPNKPTPSTPTSPSVMATAGASSTISNPVNVGNNNLSTPKISEVPKTQKTPSVTSPLPKTDPVINTASTGSNLPAVTSKPKPAATTNLTAPKTVTTPKPGNNLKGGNWARNTWNKMSPAGKVGTVAGTALVGGLALKSLFGNKKKKEE